MAVSGLHKLGFETFLDADGIGPIITSFKYPDSPNWDFQTFYNKLSDLNCLIYPGKVTNAPCFRIGHIGALGTEETTYLLQCIEQVCKEMGIERASEQPILE